MPGPLDGRLVLDFSTLLPGPLATLMLVRAGAEVIKIERPGGEDMRAFPPRLGDGDSLVWRMLNEGKTILELDLKSPAAAATLRPLIERADVVVEQFRPCVMARLGLAPEDVWAINPRIVYCSITGYGQTGPKAHVAGHDLNYIAETGLLALSHGPVDAPVLPPTQIADVGGGSYPAVMNILLGLMEADRTGRGRHLDVAMCDAMFSYAVFAIAAGGGGAWFGNGEGFLAGALPRYGLYACADGRLLAIGALEEKFWQVVCDVVGLPAALRDDGETTEETRAALRRLVAAQPSSHWRQAFEGKEACVSVVADLIEAFADPHFASRGLFAKTIDMGGGWMHHALPLPILPGSKTA